MNIIRLCSTVMLAVCLLFPALSLAGSLSDKDHALLIRIDERLNQVDKRFEQIDKRFDQVDKRFEQVDKRFDQVDKRFEQVDKRFDEFRIDMNKRFEQVNKRFEELRMDMNKRFEMMDKRFAELRTDMNKRFEEMLQIMLGIVAAFAAIVAVTISFAIWDRRTMVRPFEDKVKSMEDEIASDRRKLHGILEVLRKYARKDERLAELLRSLSLL